MELFVRRKMWMGMSVSRELNGSEMEEEGDKRWRGKDILRRYGTQQTKQ
jgi:hypothetical protein